MCLALGSSSNAQDVESQRPIPAHVLSHQRNTIEVFRAAADSVVFVTNERLPRRFRSLNVEKIPQNTGSGIIWDERGHIVTNLHVIQGGNAFSISFADGSTPPATRVGYDLNKDLADSDFRAASLPLLVQKSKQMKVPEDSFPPHNPNS